MIHWQEKGQDRRQLDALAQRPRVGGLNHGPVGDRVAVGDAQFAHRAAAAIEFLNQRGGEG